jgi:hypothetical protein
LPSPTKLNGPFALPAARSAAEVPGLEPPQLLEHPGVRDRRRAGRGQDLVAVEMVAVVVGVEREADHGDPPGT